MVDHKEKLELIIRRGNEPDTSVEEGLPTSLKPFGELVIQKGGRGKAKVSLKIKGLQQMDISNIYGAIFIAHEKKLKVYHGEGLKEESEIEYDNEIKCLKISEFDQSLITIGFNESNELHIYPLVSFVESQLKLEKFQKLEIENSFNQIKWSHGKDNNLLLRCSESSETCFINYETLEINKELGQTQAVCFDLKNNIVAIKDNNIFFYENQDLDSPVDTDLNQALPYPLSKIFHVEEYETNQWIFIGFNRTNVENKDDEDEIDGMTLEFIPCTGDISQGIESKNPQTLQIQNSSYLVDGSISSMNTYKDFLEFKLVKIAQNEYCLFQSVSETSQHIISQENGVYFTEIIEEKIKGFKGQIRGVCFASFQIDNDEAFIKVLKTKNYYQFIPPCVMTLDSHMILQKHFICNDLSLNEEAKNQPQDPSKRTNKQILIKKSDIQKEKVNLSQEEEKQIEIEVPDQKPNQEISQQNKDDKAESEQSKNQTEQQEIENKNPPQQINEKMENLNQRQPKMLDTQPENKIEPLNISNSQSVSQEEKSEIKKQVSVVEEKHTKGGEVQRNTKEIVYNKDNIKKYLENLQNFQKTVTKIDYSENRTVFNHKTNTSFKQKYPNLEFSDIKLDLGLLLQQPTIHSVEYFFEKNKLLFCTNEQDGLSHIYALTLDEYKQICQQVESLNQELESLNLNKSLNLKEKKKIIIEKKKENQEVMQKEIKKYRVFSSSQQIIQIHNIYSFFLAIVFKNGLVIKNLENIITVDTKEIPIFNNDSQQFPFTIQQLIFNKSKKYFIILTEDKRLLVMNTLNQQVLFEKNDVLFANFSFNAENEIIILQENKTIKYNINTQQQQEFRQFGNLQSYKVIHFEEFYENNFISLQYENTVMNDECSDCNNAGCSKCTKSQFCVFIAQDLNNINQVNIENHQWDMIEYIQPKCTSKCLYNPQIKQLISVINQAGTVFVMNINNNNEVQISKSNTPNYSSNLLISGIINIPYRIFNEDDEYLCYQNEKKDHRITYLYPSILIFNGIFNLNRFYIFDEGMAEELNQNENKEQIEKFSSQNTIIRNEQYMDLLQGNFSSFKTHPDFYILYQKIEEMKTVLQFLEENNLFDVNEAKFTVNDLKMMQQQEQQKIVNTQFNQQQEKGQEQQEIGQQQKEEGQEQQVIGQQQEKGQEQQEKQQEQQKQEQPIQDQLEEQPTISLVKYIGEIVQLETNKQLEQTKSIIQSLKKYDPSECIPKNFEISSQADINQTQQSKNSLKQTLEGLKPQLDKIIETSKRLKHEIIDSVFPSKAYQQQQAAGYKANLGIHQTVYYHDKEVTIFAIKNTLYLSKKNNIYEIKSSSNINLNSFENIQYIAKFPQQSDNKMHLLVALTKQQALFGAAPDSIKNTLYHIVIEDEKYKISQKICEYPNKDITNISVFEDLGEILITYSDSTVELIYAKESSKEVKVIYKWKDATFAIFTFIGTILISFKDKKISEFMALDLEESIDVFERKSNTFDGLGFPQDVSKIIYMFQYNSSAFIAIGFTEFTVIAFPVLIENLLAIRNSQNLSYTISIQNIFDKNKLQFKASYCKNMKQLYLTHNMLNEIFVLPLSINKIVHKPQIYSCFVEGIQFINGFFQTKQDIDSTTFEVCDIVKGVSKKVAFHKNKESILSIID